jgi:hypothetical protein
VHFSITPRDVGVELELAGFREIPVPSELVVQVPVPVEVVEPANFVGTVVRTVPSPYAAVVRHVVEALGRVRGRVDRADVLAGRFLALLASHRLHCDLGIVLVVSDEVPVDAKPMHLAPPFDLELADDGDVVLGLTCNDARVAARACAEVDHHAPLVALAVVLLLPKRGRADWIDRPVRREIGLLSVFIERGVDGDWPTLHAIMRLSLHEVVRLAQRLDGHPVREVHPVGRPDGTHVKPLAVAVTSRGGASPTERQRHAVVGVAGHDPGRNLDLGIALGEPKHLAVLDAELLGGGR